MFKQMFTVSKMLLVSALVLLGTADAMAGGNSKYNVYNSRVQSYPAGAGKVYICEESDPTPDESQYVDYMDYKSVVYDDNSKSVRVFAQPSADNKLLWGGWASAADPASVFYFDNVKMIPDYLNIFSEENYDDEDEANEALKNDPATNLYACWVAVKASVKDGYSSLGDVEIDKVLNGFGDNVTVKLSTYKSDVHVGQWFVNGVPVNTVADSLVLENVQEPMEVVMIPTSENLFTIEFPEEGGYKFIHVPGGHEARIINYKFGGIRFNVDSYIPALSRLYTGNATTSYLAGGVGDGVTYFVFGQGTQEYYVYEDSWQEETQTYLYTAAETQTLTPGDTQYYLFDGVKFVCQTEAFQVQAGTAYAAIPDSVVACKGKDITFTENKPVSGIVEQTLYAQGNPMGSTESDQAVLVEEVGDGIVDVSFSGFALPVMGTQVPSFTIEDVAVETAGDVKTYSAEGFKVSIPMGMMSVNYNGTLVGMSDGSAPAFHLSLQNATVDEIYFGTDSAAIAALKTWEAEKDQPAGEAWTKTGYVIPAEGWTGFYESALGQKVTVSGNEGSNTITITQAEGTANTYTITVDAKDAVTSMLNNGSVVNQNNGGYTNFEFGDSYSQFVYPYWECYGNADPENGYATISAYFYEASGNQSWAYVNIGWWDGIEEYVDSLLNPAPATKTIAFVAAEDLGTNANQQAPDTIAKDGITLITVNGPLGNGTEYRFYKGKDVIITSTVGNITSVEFTCTADTTAKYGPGNFTVTDGDYTFAGNIGTWTGNASEVVLNASGNQVRATQVVVTVASEDPTPAVEKVTLTDIALNVDGCEFDEDGWYKVNMTYNGSINDETPDYYLSSSITYTLTKGEEVIANNVDATFGITEGKAGIWREDFEPNTEYTFTINSVTVLDYTNADWETNFGDVVFSQTENLPSITFTTPAVVPALVATPETGKVESLSAITIAVADGSMISASGNDGANITLYGDDRQVIATWGAEDITKITPEFDDEYTPRGLKLTLPEEITAAGNYTLVVDAGVFYVGEEYAANATASFMWYIETPALPLELVSYELNAEGGKLVFAEDIAFADWAETLTVNVSGVKTKNIAAQATLSYDENDWKTINVTINEELEAGTYTLDIPAGKILGNDKGNVYPGGQLEFTVEEAPAPVDPNLIEIAQSQGKEYDTFERTPLVEGEEYNTYTASKDLQIAMKMMNIDVAGCDYVVVKFAEPVAAGWKLAFWSSQDLTDVPAGATEFKYVFAEDSKCGVAPLENGIAGEGATLPQICMMTFFGGYTAPLEAKVTGVYKHLAAAPAPEKVTLTDIALNVDGCEFDEDGWYKVNMTYNGSINDETPDYYLSSSVTYTLTKGEEVIADNVDATFDITAGKAGIWREDFEANTKYTLTINSVTVLDYTNADWETNFGDVVFSQTENLPSITFTTPAKPVDPIEALLALDKVQIYDLVSGTAVHGSNNQNVAVSNFVDATAATNSVTAFKLEQVEVEVDSVTTATAYTFRALTPAGENYGIWGANPSYLNSQPSVGGVSFILGKDQDIKNGSAWYLIPNENGDGTWAIKNVANGGYLAGSTISEEPVYWTLGTITEEMTGISSLAASAKADGKYIVKGQVVIVKNGVKYNLAGSAIK